MKRVILVGTALIGIKMLNAQTIGNFISLNPSTQTENFQFPTGSHTFHKIIEHNDIINVGGNMMDNLDFTGFVPISQSSRNGYLGINHELNPTGGMTVLDIHYDSTSKNWIKTNSVAIDFASTVENTRNNCSGAVTPWNTLITCEENASTSSINSLGYKQYGYCVEVNPSSKIVANYTGGLANGDKVWRAGVGNHENACFHTNMRTMYTGLDQTSGVLYKYVMDNAEDLSNGKLYALKMTSVSNGFWKLIPNTTINECNNSYNNAIAFGCTTYNGIEDVETKNNDVYFAVKGVGSVFRFTDTDPLCISDSTVTNFDVFVGNQNITYGPSVTSYNINGNTATWGFGNDNLAFDSEDNLWVLQDGGNNAIWVVGKNHNNDNIAQHDVRIFGYPPLGSEPTGITFTPDFNFLFISFQHPNSTNSATQEDANGNMQRFDKDVALVLARGEHLGNIILPLEIIYFNINRNSNSIHIDLKTTNEHNVSQLIIQKTEAKNINWKDIINCSPTYQVTNSYHFNDEEMKNGTFLYRVKVINNDNSVHYSSTKSMHINSPIQINPNPAKYELNIVCDNFNEFCKYKIFTNNNQLIQEKEIKNHSNQFRINIESLTKGVYQIVFYDEQETVINSEKFIKE